ncbi:MAG: hypothetical protein WC796_00425 [Candidatus Pacearchaeota archaeon]|jgi:hypothetical protein
MSNKRGLLVLFILVVLIFSLAGGVYAANETKTPLDKAYGCIDNKFSSVGEDCSKLQLGEKISILLAIGSLGKDDKSCLKSLMADSYQDGTCWPASHCTIKDTAMAMIALEKLDQDTTKAKDWLISQTKTVPDLSWLLEIEANEASTCQIRYDEATVGLNIAANKKLSLTGGNCFTLSENGYWLQINTNCLEKEFTVSCDKDFKTTLLYKSQNSQVIHVSQNVQSATAGTQTVEKVVYKCFKQDSVCSYEGSLWASLALFNKDIDTSQFLPYLDALSSENLDLFPESFMYMMIGSDDYLSVILNERLQGNLWNVGNYGKFYSTALAFLALQGNDYREVASAKDYLLNGKVQGQDGCWNTVKDTGWLLFAGWGNTRVINGETVTDCTKDTDCGSDQICEDGYCRKKISPEKDCTSNNHYCVSKQECISMINAVPFEELSGCSLGDICCSEPVVKKSCSASSGVFCKSNEVCSTDEIRDIADYTFEKVCCSGECELKNTETSECENQGYSCKGSCDSSTESEIDLTCQDVTNVCCKAGVPSVCGEGLIKCADGTCKSSCSTTSKLPWWIWVLVILILLVVLIIIFKDRLKVMFFKGGKKGPAPRETRPPFLPPRFGGMMPRPMGRPMLSPSRLSAPQARPMPPRPGVSNKDKEYNDTLKKLKEMSK